MWETDIKPKTEGLSAECRAVRRVCLAGPRHSVSPWSEADAVIDMPLTFDSLSLAKVSRLTTSAMCHHQSLVGIDLAIVTY